MNSKREKENKRKTNDAKVQLQIYFIICVYLKKIELILTWTVWMAWHGMAPHILFSITAVIKKSSNNRPNLWASKQKTLWRLYSYIRSVLTQIAHRTPFTINKRVCWKYHRYENIFYGTKDTLVSYKLFKQLLWCPKNIRRQCNTWLYLLSSNRLIKWRARFLQINCQVAAKVESDVYLPFLSCSDVFHESTARFREKNHEKN